MIWSVFCVNSFAQTDSLSVKPKEFIPVTKDSINVYNVIDTEKITWNTDPLSPAKAAFYSAIIPGLGQIYNKSYWKVPLVYGAIGTGIYFYVSNSNEYDRYRDAYKRRIDGFRDDEFYGDPNNERPRYSDDALRRAQNYYRRNKEMSLLITIGLYALNIIEANVDAHLKQFNVDERLSIEPYMRINPWDNQPQYGLSLNFNL
ncbi:MAG: DUF5683 domain-containing protein [Capnocytophaga sp.]|nr:DUF5683 domain-containing protein [Capnocytophaga sp.]